MQVIRSIGELVEQIEACNTALTEGSDDALRAMFGRFRMDFSGELPADPFSAAYRAAQLAIYEAVAGRAYGLGNERTLFDPAAYAGRPFPYYLQSSFTAGHHLLAIAFLLCKLELPAGARVVEFGPGWGNTTLELARLGFDVTAVDLEPNFCEVIRARAAAAGVAINVVEADFFWAETVVEPFDAAVFFECFHHCDDHMRLLRALRRAVKPGGQVYLASEPIFPAYPVPWGVRMDGEALWAARNFRVDGAWVRRGLLPRGVGADGVVWRAPCLQGRALGERVAAAARGGAGGERGAAADPGGCGLVGWAYAAGGGGGGGRGAARPGGGQVCRGRATAA